MSKQDSIKLEEDHFESTKFAEPGDLFGLPPTIEQYNRHQEGDHQQQPNIGGEGPEDEPISKLEVGRLHHEGALVEQCRHTEVNNMLTPTNERRATHANIGGLAKTFREIK